MDSYGFRRMTAQDLPRVNRWLRTPAVRRWIVSHGGRPFACLQDYDPHAWPDHHFGFLPPGSRGTDQFIGVPEMIGAGHGRQFLRAFSDRLFADGVPAIGTDPHPDNLRAVRACEHAGFAGTEIRDTAWGRCRLMVRWRAAAPVAAPGRAL